MRNLVLALALVPAAALADEVVPPPEVLSPTLPAPKEGCQNANLQRASPAQPAPSKPNALDQEPLAETYYTVLRIEGGCDKPVLVRERR